MFIYNVTTKVNWSIHEAWVQWMKEKHIPDLMCCGCFTDYRFVRVLETDETEGPTYAIQYHAATREDYDRFIARHASLLRQDALNQWGSNFVAFRSLMQVVN